MFINYHHLKTMIFRNKPYKEKEQEGFCEWDIYEKSSYNHVHNILRLFDAWASFRFTTNETIRDY